MKNIIKVINELKNLTQTNYLFLSFSDMKSLYLKYYNNTKIIKNDQCVVYLVKELRKIDSIFISEPTYNKIEKKYYYPIVFKDKECLKEDCVKMLEDIENNINFVTLNQLVPFTKSNGKTVRLIDGVKYTLGNKLCLINQDKVKEQISYYRNLNKECFGSVRMSSQYISREE